jgi:hypothetical protein
MKASLRNALLNEVPEFWCWSCMDSGLIERCHYSTDALLGTVDRLRSVLEDLMEQSVPRNLLLAKTRKMIAAGTLTGCACGCRGDFEVGEG